MTRADDGGLADPATSRGPMDSGLADRTTPRGPTVVVRDIRTASLRCGVRALGSVREIGVAKTAVDRPCFGRSGGTPPESGGVADTAITGSGAPREGERMVGPETSELERIHRVGEVIAGRLRARGFDSIGAVATADRDELTQVTGIGEVRAGDVRRSARRLLGVSERGSEPGTR